MAEHSERLSKRAEKPAMPQSLWSPPPPWVLFGRQVGATGQRSTSARKQGGNGDEEKQKQNRRQLSVHLHRKRGSWEEEEEEGEEAWKLAQGKLTQCLSSNMPQSCQPSND